MSTKLHSLLLLFILSAPILAGGDYTQESECKRGPIRKVWVDSPTNAFLTRLANLGYNKIEAVGIGYLVCRKKELATVTARQLENAFDGNSSNKVEEYLYNLEEEIKLITKKCAPNRNCRNYAIKVPLEGKMNHFSPSLVPVPLPKRIIENPQGEKLCVKGVTKKLWMDRPHVDLINSLLKKGLTQAQAFGIGYSACRDGNLTTPMTIAKKINTLLKSL